MLSAAARELLPKILAALDVGGRILTPEQQEQQADAAVAEAITAVETGEADAESVLRELESVGAQSVDPFGQPAADEETRLLQDLARTRRLGYGTARLGAAIRERDRWKLTAAGTAAGAAISLAGIAGGLGVASGLGSLPHLLDWLHGAWIGRYDPTRPGRYIPAVRQALYIRGSQADVSDLKETLERTSGGGRLPDGFQAALIGLDPPIVLMPREWIGQVPHDRVRAWDGFDDDELLNEIFGLPTLE